MVAGTNAPWLARIGSPYEHRNYARPGYAARTQLAAPFWSPTAAPRVRIPPYGFFGLGLAGLAPLPLVRLTAPSGQASTSFLLPASPALVNRTFHIQALVIHGATGPARVTNAITNRIGR